MIEDKHFKGAFYHTLNELEIPNIVISIQKGDFRKMERAHDSIHECINLAPNLVNNEDDYFSKTAFLIYHYETFWQAHRSFIEALSGYYNAAYSLLRNVLELLIRGAFWECMAHKRYRNKAQNNPVKELKDMLEERLKEKRIDENELEKTSVTIYDVIRPFLEKKTKNKITTLMIVEQLTTWGIFDPISEPEAIVYDKIYRELSKNVHVEPDKTDIGRKLLSKRNLFENEVILDELTKYTDFLHKVMDIGMVIELNILEDIIGKNEQAKRWLKERLPTIDELELNYTSSKIKEITR